MPAERIPPQNIEAEQSLLGALLIDKDAIIKIGDIVRPDDFYKDAHRIIFENMLSLYSKHEPIDLLTLTNILSANGDLEKIGGRAYLVQLSGSVPSAAHCGHYATIISKKATLRRLIQSASEIHESAYDESKEVDIILDESEQSLFAVSQKYLKHVFVELKNLLGDAFERLDQLTKQKGKLRGIATGFSDLDQYLAGLQSSDLIILAARPSMGKTSLALDIARGVATKEKIPVGIFSLEMSKEQLVDRLISSHTGIDLWKLRTGRLSDDGSDGGVTDFDRLREGMSDLSEAPIYIDDSGSANIMEIRTKARRLQIERGLGLLIIDYLQLMEGRGGSDGRVQEVSEISRSLKAIARELNIPVIALSQLSRASEARVPAIPKLSDLRESGCLAGDTLLLRADTGQLVPIRSLVRETDIPIFSLHQNLRIEKRIMTRVFCSGEKQLFELRTKSGKSIQASANHRFYTIQGWKRLDELLVGTFVATPRSDQTNGGMFTGRSWRGCSEHSDTAYPGSTVFASGLSRERMGRVATAVQRPVLISRSKSDIYWDEIIFIEEKGVEEVFDATVPGTHNFIANDIIVHNSIEQDADVVLFIYRKAMDKGLKDVPPSEKKVAEIHIAKHRNGPTGMVELFFDDERASFKNLEKQHTALDVPF